MNKGFRLGQPLGIVREALVDGAMDIHTFKERCAQSEKDTASTRAKTTTKKGPATMAGNSSSAAPSRVDHEKFRAYLAACHMDVLVEMLRVGAISSEEINEAALSACGKVEDRHLSLYEKVLTPETYRAIVEQRAAAFDPSTTVEEIARRAPGNPNNPANNSRDTLSAMFRSQPVELERALRARAETLAALHTAPTVSASSRPVSLTAEEKRMAHIMGTDPARLLATKAKHQALADQDEADNARAESSAAAPTLTAAEKRMANKMGVPLDALVITKAQRIQAAAKKGK